MVLNGCADWNLIVCVLKKQQIEADRFPFHTFKVIISDANHDYVVIYRSLHIN